MPFIAGGDMRLVSNGVTPFARCACAAVAATIFPVAALAQSTPFSGTPILVPATIEAENFDHGREGVAYHDNVVGNAGGRYRSEDVDIITPCESAGGGYAINNFETGEWLAYTVNVASAGTYDIALRVSSNFTGSAFHVEVDGVDVTGRITVSSTGAWSTFQWIGKTGVPLTAGNHVLRVVADQQYFNLIRCASRRAAARRSPRPVFHAFSTQTALTSTR